jgi:hypothetical protein
MCRTKLRPGRPSLRDGHNRQNGEFTVAGAGAFTSQQVMGAGAPTPEDENRLSQAGPTLCRNSRA